MMKRREFISLVSGAQCNALFRRSALVARFNQFERI
jgi:hypothetical protein